MKAIVVLEFDLPTPEHVADVMLAINPPRLPHFVGKARVAIEDVAQDVIDWLEEGRE